MSKAVFIVGGNRSGKSKFAQNYAESISGKKIYLATAIAFDLEMKERIKKHKTDRGNLWDATIEEPYNIEKVIRELQGKTNVLLIDCITLWLNNLLMRHNEEIEKIYNIIDNFVNTVSKVNYNIFIVSNEVGMGIVPENKLARIFRDLSGYANQQIAKIVDEFYISFCGYTLRIK